MKAEYVYPFRLFGFGVLSLHSMSLFTAYFPLYYKKMHRSSSAFVLSTVVARFAVLVG